MDLLIIIAFVVAIIIYVRTWQRFLPVWRGDWNGLAVWKKALFVVMVQITLGLALGSLNFVASVFRLLQSDALSPF